MLTAGLGAPNQRGRRGHVATLAAVVVLSLAACVDLTPPWNNRTKQDGGAEDARGAGGGLDSSAVTSGGSGGVAGEPDSTGAGGSPVGSTGMGGIDLSGGAGGVADARDASEAADSSAVASGGSGGEAGGIDSSEAGGEMDASDAAVEAISSPGEDSSRETDADEELDQAVDVGSTNDVDAESATDLEVDLGQNPPLDVATEQIACTPAYYDAKTLNHTDGWAESDGWFLTGASQFMYDTNVVYAAGRTTVMVVARGDYVSEAWPTMQITAEGQSNVIGTASVASTTMTPYEFTFTAAAMTSGFGVTVSSGGGLHVQSITIGCPTM